MKALLKNLRIWFMWNVILQTECWVNRCKHARGVKVVYWTAAKAHHTFEPAIRKVFGRDVTFKYEPFKWASHETFVAELETYVRARPDGLVFTSFAPSRLKEVSARGVRIGHINNGDFYGQADFASVDLVTSKGTYCLLEEIKEVSQSKA